MLKVKEDVSQMQLEQLGRLWLESKKETVKLTTYACYNNFLNYYITPFFGSKKVRELKKSNVIDFVHSMEKDLLSDSVIRSVLIELKAIIRYAEKLGYPLTALDEICKYNVEKPDPRVCQGDDSAEIYQIISRMDNSFAAGMLLALCTGIRVGELCGLKWSDINLEKEYFEIRRTVSRIQNPFYTTDRKKTILYIGTPKTTTSKRKIPIPTAALKKLREHRCDGEFYILTGNLKCMEPRSAQRKLKKILVDNNLNYYNMHSLRHGFATDCIANGADYKTISEILGHASIKTTMDLYVHPSMQQKRECIDNFTNTRNTKP